MLDKVNGVIEREREEEAGRNRIWPDDSAEARWDHEGQRSGIGLRGPGIEYTQGGLPCLRFPKW